MKAFAFLLLTASLCVLGGGCATDGISERVIEISVVQTKGESPGHAGLSPAQTTKLLHEVVSRLGSAGCVVYTHEHPDQANPNQLDYGFSFTPEGAYTVDVDTSMDGKHITFHGETDVDPNSIAALQKVMKLCRESLDERQIKYHLRTFTAHAFLIPASKGQPP